MSKVLDQIMSGTLDRRWIFLVMFIMVAFPYINPLFLPIPISQSTRDFYELIDELPDGSTVCFSADFGAGTWAEAGPMGVSMVNYLFQKNLKIVFITFTIDGPPIIEKVVKESVYSKKREYGVDYANLGYIPGFETGMGTWAADTSVVTVDYHGNSPKDLEIMKGINRLEDFSAVLMIGTTSYDHYIRQWSGKGVPLFVGALASGVMLIMPYYETGDFAGYIASIRGAAELEILTGIPGEGVKRMDATSMMYIYGFALMVICQFGLIKRKKKGA